MAYGKLTIIIGLPGSGKSTLLEKMRPSIAGCCVHDFHAKAFNDSSEVTASRHYQTVVSSLRAGKDCVVADIAFCDSMRKAKLEQAIQSEIPNIAIESIYFENSPDKCAQNIRRRNRERMQAELSDLDRFSRDYQLPPGVIPHQIWQPN